MERIFVKYDYDYYICRIVDMVNFCICCFELSFRVIGLRIILEYFFCKVDEMSWLVYEVFEVYIEGIFLIVMEYIREVDLFLCFSNKILEGIGILVIKFYKCLFYDKLILNVI